MNTEVINKYPMWETSTRGIAQAVYEQMRQENPICPLIGPVSKRTFWFFTNYDDCVAVLKDPRFGKEFDKHLPPEMINQQDYDPAFDVVNKHMLNLDPPDHTRLRALIHKAFTPRMIQNLQPRIEEIANDLLDDMRDASQGDLLADFGFPLPITVIAEMLGIDAADRDKFRDWTKILLFSVDVDSNYQAMMEFAMYMHDLIDKRTAEPKDDLISGLVQAEEEGDKLSREELLSMIFLLLVAGHETTVNLIGNGTLALMQNPDQKDKLIKDPSLIKTAVEEMLRFNGPVETPTMRWAFEDVEISGVTIPQGDLVLPSLLAANRDPLYFENPHHFDITRNPNKHIAFGNGIHYCLGAPLARMEGSIAINALLGRFPNIHLSVNYDEIEWTPSILIHGMTSLPVSYR